ncbi:MAG: hypothetical protein EXS24_01870 [Pedosphaera sp.]|nr:hypothetical protein [Pedosphaera sp.]
MLGTRVVNLVRRIVGLVLLLVHLPCTAHCQMKAMGLFGSQTECCESEKPSSGSSSDCQDCVACQSVESTGYVISRHALLLNADLAVASDFPAIELADTSVFHPNGATECAGWIDFQATRWQLDFRAPSTPRGPPS